MKRFADKMSKHQHSRVEVLSIDLLVAHALLDSSQPLIRSQWRFYPTFLSHARAAPLVSYNQLFGVSKFGSGSILDLFDYYPYVLSMYHGSCPAASFGGLHVF